MRRRLQCVNKSQISTIFDKALTAEWRKTVTTVYEPQHR